MSPHLHVVGQVLVSEKSGDNIPAFARLAYADQISYYDKDADKRAAGADLRSIELKGTVYVESAVIANA